MPLPLNLISFLMIEIESDETKNLFVIRYHGHVTAEETGSWVEPMQQALAKMRPGFGLLVDFTDLESMDADCAPHIGQIMDYCNANDVAAVVRVIPDPQRDIGMQSCPASITAETSRS